MIRIAICICTRRRKEGIIKLLESFEKMKTAPDMDIRIIVVENDKENFTEQSIIDFSKSSRHKIEYYLETKPGLVMARNRSVKEAGNVDFCCFTDDDEIVSETWMTELFRCQKEFGADGVAGPTFPDFGRDVPDYIKDFHTPATFSYGTIVDNAYTGCLLLRKKYLDMISGPFDERLNYTGGEDIFLTYLISDLGGIIRYNPNASAFEIFSEDRLTVKYILRRTYRNSNTGLYARSLRNPDHFKLKAFPKLILRLGNGIILALPLFLAGGRNKLKGIIKIISAVGGIQFIIGRQNKFYK
jgi:succinoglycan biosynthesis protein ExoM